MQNEKVQKVSMSEGLEIFKIPLDKFKTNTVTVYFHDELTRENVALNALLPAVLKQGSEDLPTRKDISIRLQELYGAVFDCGVSKKGELQLTYFYMETIKDRYASKDAKLWEQVFELLFGIISRPLLEDGVFSKEYVNLEKANNIKIIEGRINDKGSYAYERCLEEMCKDEPFSIFEYGEKEDYNDITPQNLHAHYLKMLETKPISVYLTGEVTEEMIELVKSSFEKIKKNNLSIPCKSIFRDAPTSPAYVEEKMNVNQGKLCIGYRNNIDPACDDYYKLMVFNSILGGGIHSKLFQNVREKEGLAYYAGSRLERFKGIMALSSGIDISNKDKVLDIINIQFEDMKNGVISDYEFDCAKKTIENSINSMKDSQLSLTDFSLGQNILGIDETLDSVIEKINAVTKDDLIKISESIKIDTIYFLTGV